MQVGKCDHIVVEREIGLVDAADGEPSGAYSVLVDEVGKNAIARFQLELIGHCLGNQELVAVLVAREDRYPSAHHVVVDECSIVFFGNTLELYAEEVIICFQNAFFQSETLGMSDALQVTEHVEHRIVDNDGILLWALQCGEFGHLNVASESRNLVLNGMFKSHHHAHTDDHHSQANGHAGGCYAYGRLRNVMLVVIFGRK